MRETNSHSITINVLLHTSRADTVVLGSLMPVHCLCRWRAARDQDLPLCAYHSA